MSTKPDTLSRCHNHKEVHNPKQIMLEERQFIGFKAEVATDIISQIRDAQEDDKSLEVLIQSTKEKDKLPPSIQKQYSHNTWEQELLCTK